MGLGAPGASGALAALAWVCWFQLLGQGVWHGFWRGRSPGREVLPGVLELFFQQVLGMGAAMALLLLLAVAGLFHWPGLAGAMAVSVSVAAWVGRGRAWLLPRCAPWEWLALACAVLLAVAVSWRFPGAWDDTAYHLPMARTIVDHHALVANEWLRFPYFPAFMHLLFAAGLLVDVWLAQWLATWPVVLALLGLMGAARWLCRHAGWGVLAWALYLRTPALEHSLGFAYVDAALALFCMAAVLAVAQWAQPAATGARTWLWLGGACAGIAGGIKFHGLVVAAALGGVVLIRSLCLAAPDRAKALRRDLLAYALPCAALAGFWYLRSYWLTGDPIHPAGGSVFGYYLWTAQDMALQVAEQASHGVPKQWAHFLQAIWHARVPYLYAAFFVPLLLVVPGARVWAVVGAVVWVVTLFWFWISQVDRYLMPVLPLAALLCVGLVWRVVHWFVPATWIGRTVRRRGLAVLALACCVYLVWWSVQGWWQRPTVLAQRDGFAEIALLQRAQDLAPEYGTRVLDLGYENAFYYYRGELVGDWFGRAAFWRVADCSQQCRMRSPEETQQTMRALGARMVLIHSGKFPFDEAQYSAQMVLLGKSGAGFLYGLRPGR